MSRIHDALKRAEQERAGFEGQQVVSRAAGEGAAAELAPVAKNTLSALTPTMPMPAPALTLDALLTRCRQSDWRPDLKTMLFFNTEEQVRGTEPFRALCSQLYEMREKRPLKKVLVTSSSPKEGKSFVAANLAQALVKQRGCRALLIDADLQSARLHLALGTAATPGLTEYLLGESDEFSVLQRGAMENLFFIPSGRTVASPAELVENGRLQILLHRMGPLFDWIILDSSTAVAAGDAGPVADFCDGILLVVRSDGDPSEVAGKARQKFKGQRLVGVVLNAN
jgi:capsular exopolysaccharide synthesis family protein